MNLWRIFVNGIFSENPIFRLALSLCPALAVTSTVKNALTMGLVVLFVITANNTIVSLFRRFINPKVRVPVYITIIATLVTVASLVLEAFVPDLYRELGIYLELVVVFAIILARAEVFATKQSVIPSFIDGLGMGAGFTLAMVLVGVLREVIGNGTLFGVTVLWEAYQPILIAALPPGGFLVIGFIIGACNMIGTHMEKAADRKKKQAKIQTSQSVVEPQRGTVNG